MKLFSDFSDGLSVLAQVEREITPVSHGAFVVVEPLRAVAHLAREAMSQRPEKPSGSDDVEPLG